MEFIFSKIIGYLISPFVLLFIVAIFILYNRNSTKLKTYLGIFIALMYFFSCPTILQILAKTWDITTPKTQLKHYSCAIVLGGYVSRDKNGIGFFSSFSDRFIQATRLFKSNHFDYLLVSGGNSNIVNDRLFKEADFVASVLKEMQIPDTAILLENKARNTYENAIFSKQLLHEKGISPPYLLITSAFHMRRSLLHFKKNGIDVVPYSCDYLVDYNNFKINDLIPNIETFAKWNIYIHEIVGYVAYKLSS